MLYHVGTVPRTVDRRRSIGPGHATLCTATVGRWGGSTGVRRFVPSTTSQMIPPRRRNSRAGRASSPLTGPRADSLEPRVRRPPPSQVPPPSPLRPEWELPQPLGDPKPQGTHGEEPVRRALRQREGAGATVWASAALTGLLGLRVLGLTAGRGLAPGREHSQPVSCGS